MSCDDRREQLFHTSAWSKQNLVPLDKAFKQSSTQTKSTTTKANSSVEGPEKPNQPDPLHAKRYFRTKQNVVDLNIEFTLLSQSPPTKALLTKVQSQAIYHAEVVFASRVDQPISVGLPLTGRWF